jgi:hypothetical protein
MARSSLHAQQELRHVLTLSACLHTTFDQLQLYALESSAVLDHVLDQSIVQTLAFHIRAKGCCLQRSDPRATFDPVSSPESSGPNTIAKCWLDISSITLHI